jgi:hypothetical protein
MDLYPGCCAIFPKRRLRSSPDGFVAGATAGRPDEARHGHQHPVITTVLIFFPQMLTGGHALK